MSRPLRIVVINHVHPTRRHVSALRMRTFAEHLSGLGDQVLLLSDATGTDVSPTQVQALPELITRHDWSAPLYISTRPQLNTLSAKAREGRLPCILRQAVIAGAYLWTGGIFGDWRSSAAPLLPAIARSFKPDVVLATFGNTDAWRIAQTLAGFASCPWIADMKDNWRAFIPFGLRRITARRFADMACLTVYSEGHRREADNWFPQSKTVIYSGYDHGTSGHPAPTADITDNIVLSGSLYDDASLAILTGGIADYAGSLTGGRTPVLVYAGNDGDRFDQAAAGLTGLCATRNAGYLDPDALRDLQSTALANVYIENPRSLFQQKVLELLAAGRPVIAVPSESEEALGLARQTGGILYRAADVTAVHDALQQSVQAQPTGPSPEIEAYSWAAQTQRLRDIMARVAGQVQ